MTRIRLLGYLLVFLISFLLFIAFITLPLPFATNNPYNYILSCILFLIVCQLIYHHIVVNKIFDLSLFFNVAWLLSFSMALLSLSSVQRDLSSEFIFYLLLLILTFNLGYLAYSRIELRKRPTWMTPTISTVELKSLIEKGQHILDSRSFRVYFLLGLLLCIAGYIYEIKVIGFVPLLAAQEEGFYSNRTEFVSYVHYLTLTLAAYAGASLALNFITKSKKFYAILFIIGFILTLSQLTKNVLFMTIFYFVGLLNCFRPIPFKKVIIYTVLASTLLLLSSAIRTGSGDYIKLYSRIGYDELPTAFYWINTYFAINITHMGSYFENGYTETYGLRSIGSMTSFMLLRSQVDDIIGNMRIYYSGLGGNINVYPLLTNYMFDFGLLAFVPVMLLGFISSMVNHFYQANRSYFSAILFGMFSYILFLSVFGDFLNRLMLPLSALALLLPYYLSQIRFKRIRR